MKHEQRVVGHASGWQEPMGTCACGKPWPCAGDEISSNERLLRAAKALADALPKDRGLGSYFARNELLELRAAMDALAVETKLPQPVAWRHLVDSPYERHPRWHYTEDAPTEEPERFEALYVRGNAAPQPWENCSMLACKPNRRCMNSDDCNTLKAAEPVSRDDILELLDRLKHLDIPADVTRSTRVNVAVHPLDLLELLEIARAAAR